MPELIRSAVSRMRLYFKDRRESPRLRTRLVFTVSIHRTTDGNARRKSAPFIQGHTRDISADGMALLVPQVHLDGYHLAAERRELEVSLEFGGQPTVRMIVVPRRYEQLEEPELGCGYLIGAQIIRLAEEDRRRYLSFIDGGLAGQWL